MDSLNILDYSAEMMLGYYSPSDSRINQLTDTCEFNIEPFEESIRRVYLHSYSGLSGKSIAVTVSIQGAKKFSFESKVLIGRDEPTVIDFNRATSTSIVTYDAAEKSYTNGLPIDIYIKSLTNTRVPVYLDINITTDLDSNAPPIDGGGDGDGGGGSVPPVYRGSLSFDTTTTTVTNYPIDLVLLQDLSGSFDDDLATIRGLVPSLYSEVTAIQPDSRFGVASFCDKPKQPFGDSTDFIYQINLPLTSSQTSLQNSINSLQLKSGNDGPEAQLEALQQIALTKSQLGYRTNAVNLVVLFTDAEYHVEGDNPGIVNNGDTNISAFEDYPGVAQVKQLLESNNIYPIFSVTSDVTSIYQNLVSQLGRGSVVNLSSNSSNLVTAVTNGINNAPIRKILLPLTGTVTNISIGALIELTLVDSTGYTMNMQTTVAPNYSFSFGAIDFSAVSDGNVTITVNTVNDVQENITRSIVFLYER